MEYTYIKNQKDVQSHWNVEWWGDEIKLYLDFEKYIKWSFDISNDDFNANGRGYEWIRVEDQNGRPQIVKVNGDGNNPALKKFLKEREKMIIERLLRGQRGGWIPTII